MSTMTPRQILAEILQDYRYHIKKGMPVDESLEILKSMVVDMIEFEKGRSFERGRESGTYAILHELYLYGPEYVISKYKQLGEATPRS